MNYRVILMGSGLLMMFAVYGLVMMIGAMVGEDDAATGNAIMALIFTTFSVTALRVGLSQRRKAHVRIDSVINDEFDTHGYVDALRFSKGAGVSLDDARDILDKKYVQHGWKRTELASYNAEYRRP